MKKFKFFLIIIVIFAAACNKNNNNSDKTPIATAFDKKLYIEDIMFAIPDDISPEDSVMIVKDKIELWIKKQVMLNIAEINLSQKQKNVENIVQDYKASLLIDRYKQEFLKQKLDTIVSPNEIQDYYQTYKESFKLNREILIADFYKFSVNASGVADFRQLFYSDKSDSKAKMKEFIRKNNANYQDFNGKWIAFSEISSLLPTKISNPELILKSTNKIQTQDNEFYYFVKIIDYRLKGQFEPAENVSEQIKLVIVNKRKVDIINELESVIYQNALENGNVKIIEK